MPEVVILQVDIQIGVDQLVLDVLPDDAGHLIAVELDDGIGDLDLRHRREPRFRVGRLDLPAEGGRGRQARRRG
jgi:hypothetical protein